MPYRSRSAVSYAVDAAETALWPDTEELLGQNVLREIAGAAGLADDEGAIATASLDRLRDARYFGLPVPTSLRGLGASLLECAAVQRRLAAADPGLAIAANMHLFSLGMAVEHWLRHHDTCGLLLEAIADQQRIVASAFAEPGLGGSILRSNTKARRTDQGYLATGVKSPCSLAEVCDLMCLQMVIEPAEPRGLVMAIIPARAPGIVVERTWNTLGMRGSGSETVRLAECFVPDSLIFHRCNPGFDDDEVFAAGLIWFCVTTTATYLGLVKAAMGAASDGLRRARLEHLGCSRADLPTLQTQLGELVSSTLAIEAACVGVAERLDRRLGDPRALLPAALALKHAAIEACVRFVDGAAELVGGSAYARTSALARLLRDVEAIRFHPPTRPISRQILGRWALGLPFTFELDEHPG